VWTAIGFLGPAIALSFASIIPLTQPMTIVITIASAVMLSAFALAGYGSNHLDVAPLIAGHVFSVENVIGTIPGIVSPILTGYIVREETQQEWSLVFYITAAIYTVGAVVFGLFGRGDRAM
jgi:hypothetical protein